MYARQIGENELTFGVSGKLIRNVLVMYDRQTESLWSQLLGESVAGDHLGDKLEYVPSWHTTWKAWKELHPDTLALKKGFGGSRDPYTSYYQSSSTGIIGEASRDNRLPAKDFVIGVELPDGSAKAYSYRSLSLEPVFNDSAGGYDILITFDPDTATGVVFDRKVSDSILSFAQVSEEPFTMQDDQTGTSWNALTGAALNGPLAGESLNRIKSTAAFWFGWTDFHPDTALYNADN